MNSISINACPGAIKRLAMVFKEIVKVFECKDINELIKESKNIPLEMAAVAEKNKKGKTVKHYFVGLAIPSKKDEFTQPLLYFSSMSYEQFVKYNDAVNEAINKKNTVDQSKHRSNIWYPGR